MLVSLSSVLIFDYRCFLVFFLTFCSSDYFILFSDSINNTRFQETPGVIEMIKYLITSLCMKFIYIPVGDPDSVSQIYKLCTVNQIYSRARNSWNPRHYKYFSHNLVFAIWLLLQHRCILKSWLGIVVTANKCISDKSWNKLIVN